MGSPHLTIFIVARKGHRGATRNVLISFYNHSQYGMQVIDQILPILRVAQSHPFLFHPRDGRPLLVPGAKGDVLDEELFRFLLTCVSYSLESGLRDSHVHFDQAPEETLTKKSVTCDNGATFIDISDIENLGVSYCVIMSRSRWYDDDEPTYPLFCPLSLKEYLSIYEKDPRLESNADAAHNVQVESEALLNLRAAYRAQMAHSWTQLDELECKLLTIEELLPIWPDLQKCRTSNETLSQPCRLAEAAERPSESRVDSLCELAINKVANMMRDMPSEKQATLLDFPPTLQTALFERLCKSEGRHFVRDASCILPLSMSDISCLDLANCTQLTDSGLAAIASSDAARNRLKQFTISNNHNISSKAINLIASSCHNLTDLRVVHCSKITASELNASAKAIMSFSYGLKDFSLDVYVIFPFRDSGRTRDRIFKIRRDWLYGKAALYFVLKMLQCREPIWMPFSSYFASPYGNHANEDQLLMNYTQTQADHLFGILNIDEQVGIFDDVWTLRRPVVGALLGCDTQAPGATHKSLFDADLIGAPFFDLKQDPINGPENGAVIIDLSDNAPYSCERKYCFMATRGPALGLSSATPMKPLSAREYFDCFFAPTNPELFSQWSDGRSEQAKEELLQLSMQLAETISSEWQLLTSDRIKSLWPSYN